MYIKNSKEKGVEIRTRIGMYKWLIPNDDVIYQVEDEIGTDLLSRYGFLEKIEKAESQEPLIEEVAEGYKCSLCDYVNKRKIGVYGHLKHDPHKLSNTKAVKLEPVGTVIPRPSLIQRRNLAAARQARYQGEDKDFQGLNDYFYGEGMVETKL